MPKTYAKGGSGASRLSSFRIATVDRSVEAGAGRQGAVRGEGSEKDRITRTRQRAATVTARIVLQGQRITITDSCFVRNDFAGIEGRPIPRRGEFQIDSLTNLRTNQEHINQASALQK